MNLIDGKTLAREIREQVKREIIELGLHPKLGVLLVGDDPSSHIYVNLKEKAAQEVGIETDIRRLPADTPDEELKKIIEDWNADAAVNAILIQIPLPAGHDTDALIAAIDPQKDVDGFHPQNLAAINSGQGEIFPPVHKSILHLIGATPVDLRNAKTLIISNSDIFADPLTRLLSRAGSAVDCVRPDAFENEEGKGADIIVIAVGRAGFLNREAIKSGACIIDVGTNRLPDGKVVGDVDAESVKDLPGWLSPVPGGVGPLTVALLLKNTVKLAKRGKLEARSLFSA